MRIYVYKIYTQSRFSLHLVLYKYLYINRFLARYSDVLCDVSYCNCHLALFGMVQSTNSIKFYIQIFVIGFLAYDST